MDVTVSEVETPWRTGLNDGSGRLGEGSGAGRRRWAVVGVLLSSVQESWSTEKYSYGVGA